VSHEPYALFNLPRDADDEMIRRRYLELVRENPPEKDAARFSAIRQAYDQLKDIETRMRTRLYHVDDGDTIGKVIEDLTRHGVRSRASLPSLMEMVTTK